MEHKERTTSRRRDRQDDQPQDLEDLRDEQLDADTAEVLDDIACCLAEVEEENDLAVKRAAKAEWDAIRARYWAENSDMDQDTFYYEKAAWYQKYDGVITMVQDCCGVLQPDFSGLE